MVNQICHSFAQHLKNHLPYFKLKFVDLSGLIFFPKTIKDLEKKFKSENASTQLGKSLKKCKLYRRWLRHNLWKPLSRLLWGRSNIFYKKSYEVLRGGVRNWKNLAIVVQMWTTLWKGLNKKYQYLLMILESNESTNQTFLLEEKTSIW